MGKTLRLTALAAAGLALTGALSGMAAAQNPSDLRITGISLSVTSGTLELNRVSSTAAWLNAEASAVITQDVLLEARTSDRREINAKSPTGIITLTGDTTSREDEIPDLASIRLYAKDFLGQAGYGDVLMQGEASEPAEASIEGESYLRSSLIIWSQRFGRVIVPSAFEQQATMPSGTALRLRGNALSVDRDFRNWTFFSAPGEPIRMEFIPAQLADNSSEVLP